MQTILVTGGTGLVGKNLVAHLVKKNYHVIILTRSIDNIEKQKNVEYALWDVKNGTIDIDAIQKADAIIHLAGAGVMDKKWDEHYMQEIEDSRTKSSALLVKTLQNNTHKVRVIVSSSAIGWYGEDKLSNHYFVETDKADEGFLGRVCSNWEQSIEAASALNIRVCKLRTGIVLANEGGAYKEFKTSIKYGIAAILGNGKQMVSWIHIDDLCRQFIFAIENENMSGSYNAVAPNPVNNKELTLTIANTIKGKFYIPIHVPTFILKLMLGKRSIEILKSTTVSSDKIKAAGFTFLYPSILSTVAALEKK
jgi:uncharacterized protein